MLNHEDSNDVVYAAVVLIYFAFRRTLTCATEFCLQDDEDNKLALLVFEAASAADGQFTTPRAIGKNIMVKLLLPLCRYLADGSTFVAAKTMFKLDT